MTTFGQDLRYAVRSLSRSPGFTLAAIATLALGIGANTAVYSLVRGVLFRALPFPAPEQLVAINETNPTRGYPVIVASPPNYLDWKTQSRSFSAMGAYTITDLALSDGGAPERLRATTVTAGFFEALGVAPLSGRTFAEGEFVKGSDHVAVVSHGLWTAPLRRRPVAGRQDHPPRRRALRRGRHHARGLPVPGGGPGRLGAAELRTGGLHPARGALPRRGRAPRTRRRPDAALAECAASRRPWKGVPQHQRGPRRQRSHRCATNSCVRRPVLLTLLGAVAS